MFLQRGILFGTGGEYTIHMSTQLTQQLNKVRGQVDAIARMMNEDRDCLDVVQQILAARNALGKIGKDFLTNEAVRCSRSSAKKDQFDAILKQLFSLGS